MAGKRKRTLELEKVFLHYRDETGKKQVIKIRTSGLDSIIFSREVADKIRPLFPPGGVDPEEPVEEMRATTLAGANDDPADDGDTEDGDTGNCYIVQGQIICP